MTGQAPTAQALEILDQALGNGHLTTSAATNIRRWLENPAYRIYQPKLAAQLREERWEVLEDVFWTSIPFGTAGRRGRMYPIGCNAINERTIGETVQALAEYVNEVSDGPRPSKCAIAYDTRHRSEEFARLAAEIMVAAGLEVEFFEDYRSTPLLATTVRYKQCACGIMISASHNPPSDNAAKVFWSTGGQLKPPHDEEVTRRLEHVGELIRVDFETALDQGKIRYVAEEMDTVYRDAVLAEGFDRNQGRRDLKIAYSPLHGVGLTSVVPVLVADGFEHVDVYPEHAEANGCFPNVPDNIANPENAAVFDEIIDYAKERQLDLIIASDPDADRLGCAAPVRMAAPHWKTLNGNQIAVLLTEYVLRKRAEQGTLTPQHYIVKTIVTTQMMRAVANHYGITTHGECLTGFKWIGGLVDQLGPEHFLLGAEEAHGYLIGTHLRDKDGAVAAMLLAEMAAEAKSQGQTLHDQMHGLYRRHGLYLERTVASRMPGADGMKAMQQMMKSLRDDPPRQIGGLKIVRQRDYLTGRCVELDSGDVQPLNGPQGNLLMFESEVAGNDVAVRPSGTEPKIKFYLFSRLAPEQSQDLESARVQLTERLDQMQSSLESWTSD